MKQWFTLTHSVNFKNALPDANLDLVEPVNLNVDLHIMSGEGSSSLVSLYDLLLKLLATFGNKSDRFSNFFTGFHDFEKYFYIIHQIL